MTRQEIFDKVLFGLRKQGAFAWDSGAKACAYLTEDGNKCAAGMLIPDGHEAQACVREWRGVVDIYPELSVGHGDLVRELQCIHDHCAEGADWPKWEQDMKKLAEKEGLVYTPKEGTP